jgi:hypothetical protein
MDVIAHQRVFPNLGAVIFTCVLHQTQVHKAIGVVAEHVRFSISSLKDVVRITG